MWNVIFFIASFVLSQYMQSRQKPEDAKPAGMGEFNFPTATEGRVIPLIRGTIKVDGPNVVWYGDYSRVPITKDTGGMFSSDYTVGYSYYFGMMMGLCIGPASKILRIWSDQKLLWQGEALDGDTITIDQDGFFGGPDVGGGGIRGRLQFHSGTTDQAVDTYLKTQFGADNTPAYRGLTYVTWQGPSSPVMYDPRLAALQKNRQAATENAFVFGAQVALGFYEWLHRPRMVGYLGTQSQVAAWGFEVQVIPNPLGLGTLYGSGSVNTYDYNPAAFLYEVMTDTSWGLGRSVDDLDLTSFVDAAGVLYGEGNGISISFDTATEAKEIMNLIEEQINGKVILNPQTGKWELRLIRKSGIEDYNADRELNERNIIEMNNVARGSWDGTVNHVSIEFTDRDKEYGTSYAPAHDLGNVRIQGGRVVVANLRYPGVKNATLAADLAWRELRMRALPLLRCDIVVDRTQWDVLPGDLVYLYDPKRKIQYTGDKGGLSYPAGLPMRVLKVDWGQLADGKITLSVVQDNYYTQTLTKGFSDQSTNVWIPPTYDLTAFDATDLLLFEAPYGIVRRSSMADGNYPWCGAIYKDDGSVSYVPIYRNNDGVYAASREIRRFIRKGQLAANMSATDVEFSIVQSGEDSVDEIVNSLPLTTSSDIGNNLANLMLIGGEFLAATEGKDMDSAAKCVGVYRGLLDSVPETHTAGDTVWVIGSAGGLVQSSYAVGDSVYMRVVPKSSSEFGDADEAIDNSFSVRGRKDVPYPPSKVILNTVDWAGSVDGTTHLVIDWWRRDKDVLNELENRAADQGLGTDVAYQIELYRDNGGSWDLEYRFPWTSNATWTLSNAQLTSMLGVYPGTPVDMKVVIRTERLFPAPVIQAASILSHEFTLTW
jgi:hypothetical protein